MKKEEKTNVMRLLDGKKIPYESHSYEPDVTMSGRPHASRSGSSRLTHMSDRFWMCSGVGVLSMPSLRAVSLRVNSSRLKYLLSFINLVFRCCRLCRRNNQAKGPNACRLCRQIRPRSTRSLSCNSQSTYHGECNSRKFLASF